MRRLIVEVLIGLLIASILGVGKHTYGVAQRLNTLEVKQVYDKDAIEDIRTDVKEIKNFLMGGESNDR